MKKIKLLLLIIFILQFNNCGNNNTAQLYNNALRGSISGNASLSSLTANLSPKYSPNKPGDILDFAEVFATDINGNSYGPVYTDSYGNFNMSGLPVSSTHYIIKVKKDKIELRAMIKDVVYGQTTDIGSVDITTTTVIHLLEKRLKEETGQDVKLGEAGFVATDVKTKITEIDIEKEKKKFKESIEGDSSPNNPIYVVFATVTAVVSKANINGFSLSEFLSNPNLSVEVEYEDGTTAIVNNDAIDTQISNVRIINNIFIYPDTFTVFQNDTIQLKIIAEYTNGDTSDITDSAVCSLSDTANFSFNKGLLTTSNSTGALNINISLWGFNKNFIINILSNKGAGNIFYIWEDIEIISLNTPVPVIATQNFSYTISWDIVLNANSYIVQESNLANFSNISNEYEIYTNSIIFNNKPAGNYYYRIKSKTAGIESGWSEIKSVNVPEYGSAIIIW